MKLLYISLDVRMNDYNAQYIHTFSLAEYLNRKIKTDILIGGNKNETIKVKNLKVFINKFNPPLEENIIIKMFNVISKHLAIINYIIKNGQKYNYIYERCRIGNIVGFILAKYYKVPLICELNGLLDEELFEGNKINNLFLRKLLSTLFLIQLKLPQKIIVQTEELKKILHKKYNLNNIYVVENGVMIKNNNNHTFLNNNTPIITFVGALSSSHNLSHVFDLILKSNKTFIFYVIGDGNLKNKYKETYSFDKRIIFTGKIEHNDVAKNIKLSDFCIASYPQEYLPFKKYGFYFCPLKLLEYSSLGKPTLMYSATNSFVNIFKDNNACFITLQDEEFINYFNILISDRKTRSRMGENAYKTVKKFTWERSAKLTEKIILYEN